MPLSADEKLLFIRSCAICGYSVIALIHFIRSGNVWSKHGTPILGNLLILLSKTIDSLWLLSMLAHLVLTSIVFLSSYMCPPLVEGKKSRVYWALWRRSCRTATCLGRPWCTCRSSRQIGWRRPKAFWKGTGYSQEWPRQCVLWGAICTNVHQSADRSVISAAQFLCVVLQNVSGVCCRLTVLTSSTSSSGSCYRRMLLLASDWWAAVAC